MSSPSEQPTETSGNQGNPFLTPVLRPHRQSPRRSPLDVEPDINTNGGAHPSGRVRIADSVGPALQLSKEHFRVPLKASECSSELGFAWPLWRKWLILIIVFLVQVSMNLNTTLYSNAVRGIAADYGVCDSALLWGGAASFLITYAFGCELWAPWSEEFGRRLVLQASLSLVNAWAFLVAFAPNFAAHSLGRALGGLSTAGGSVTLAVITDLFKPDDDLYQHATLFIVLSSVGGSIIGPIIGGFVEENLAWQWCIWIQIIFGIAVQLLHAAAVPETRVPVLMDRIARKRRKNKENLYVYGPGELAEKQIDWAETWQVWLRPFRMFLTEPIVLTLSLLSGFSDALIFMMVQSFSIVYQQWSFTPSELGLSFIPIGIGYLLAYISFFPAIKRNVAQRASHKGDEHAQYEARLWWLLWTVPLLPLGLLVFAFTAAWAHPPIHWVGSMFASCMIGIANFAIYMATINYVLRAYGPYAASATGGNGWARDFLAGLLTPFAVPMYERMGTFGATMMLFGLALLFCMAVYIVYWFGPTLRRRSPFAQTLAHAEDENNGHAVDYLPPGSMPGSRVGSRPGSRANSQPGSRRGSRVGPVDGPGAGSVRRSIELRPLTPIVPLISAERGKGGKESRSRKSVARRKGNSLQVLAETQSE
ncbi:major facilitator superfamily domain-containing protein [Biscogniauxia marginata]|nr:major facilitator superfamily domain-containing protein [Biscogniauxia marginata]